MCRACSTLDAQLVWLTPDAVPQVTLFIGNLTPQWTDAARLRSELGAHGSIERAAVLRNAQGASKVLG